MSLYFNDKLVSIKKFDKRESDRATWRKARNFLFFNEKEGFELNRWGNFGLDRNVRYSHDDLVGSYEFRNYVIDNNVLYKKPYIEFTYTDDSVVVYYNTFEEVAHEYEKYKNIYGDEVTQF